MIENKDEQRHEDEHRDTHKLFMSLKGRRKEYFYKMRLICKLNMLPNFELFGGIHRLDLLSSDFICYNSNGSDMTLHDLT